MYKKFFYIIFFILIILLLGLAVKGHKGNPVFYQNSSERDMNVGGPFESSNSSSRFVLTEAIVEDHRFTFDLEQARFAAPDLVEYNGRLFTVFTPGVSFMSVPFYILGKAFNLPQLFSYFSVTIFSVINVFLIYILARKLNAGVFTSLICGFIYLFGTNSFAYALSFTQHPMSTTMVLLAVINSLCKRTFINNFLLGLIVGAGLLMDIPNMFMMIPVIIFVLIKQFNMVDHKDKIKVSFKPNIIALLVGLAPLIIFFSIYNHELTGSYTKIGQMIGRTDYEEVIKIQNNELQGKNAQNIGERHLPFNSRNLLNGFYILLLSNERSWIYYSPVVLLGIAGLIIAYRKKETNKTVLIITSVIGTNIVMYSMFGDPWGGWSFSARYLIPSAALMSVGIAPVLDKFNKNIIFILIFLLISSYSIGINTLGAMTTSSIPPKVEAEQLDTHIPYTYQYNLDLVEKNLSSSLFYNLYLHEYISSRDYIKLYVSILLGVLVILYGMAYFEKSKKEMKYEYNNK